MSDYSLSFNQGAQDAPTAVQLAPGQSVRVFSIVARWDGAGAGGSFHPACSIYSPDGVLVTRTRPEQVFAPGDSGVVTYAPFLHSPSEPAPSAGGLPYWKQVLEVPTPGDNTDFLYLLPTSGPPATQIATVVNENIRAPVLSPDETLVVYTRGGTVTQAVRVVGSDGSGDTQILANGRTPDWKPDSSGVVLLRIGVGLGFLTPAGVFTSWAIVGTVPNYTADGSTVAYWDTALDDLRACDDGGGNDRLLDAAAPATAIQQRLATANLSNRVGYGYAVTGTDYYRIETDATGRTQMNPAGYNVNSNPLVFRRAWAPDDSYYLSVKFVSSLVGWEVTKFFADGVTAPEPMGFFTNGSIGAHPRFFGGRIYFVEGKALRGGPLVSILPDGTDRRVEDDCNGGSTDCQLGLE